MTTNTTMDTTIKVYNTNPQFGEPGPYDVASIDALVEDMMPTFKRWAEEKFDATAPEDRDGDRAAWIEEQISETVADFYIALYLEE
jgi:hypothetical protein